MIFPEERKALSGLLEEWYGAIKDFTEECNGIFTAKAKQYDQQSPVWHRLNWPHSFTGEIQKKNDRIRQMLVGFDSDNPVGSVDWDEVNEELSDIVNYARMMAGINVMIKERE